MTRTTWGEELKHAIRSRSQLLSELDLPSDKLFSTSTTGFDLLAPRPYVKRIRPGDPNDPLLLQILSSPQELVEDPSFSSDPLEEQQHNPAPGIIHKYTNRVLFVLTGQCAINCRYCFRRHFPYAEQRRSKQQWLEALKYIEQNAQIKEVIFSGGDPLVQSNSTLAFIMDHIAQIPHIKRIRIHTRLPLVIPARIDSELIDIFARNTKRISLVWHINHPNEIDHEVQQTAARLRPIVEQFNQSVLLKGINDNSTVLAQLSETLHDCYIQPYYIHLLDRVQGAAHFLIEDQEAAQIYKELASLLPGFLLPKLAREISGEAAKTTYGTSSL